MIRKMMELGSLNITDEVFSMIASISVEDIYGIAGTVSGLRDEFNRVITKKNSSYRGVTVECDEDTVSINIKIAVYYGGCIADICYKLQQYIKEEIEMMTGIYVSAVNVSVEQVVVRSI